MDKVVLDVQARDKGLKAKELLRRNLIPAEFYGKGVNNKSFQIDYQSFRKAYNAAGGNTIMEINIEDKEKINVLVHDVETDPVTDKYIHIDLINVKMDQAIHTNIPLNFVGTSLAVKDENGIFMAQISEIEVKCLPKDLVHNIDVNIESIVDFTVHICVSDLNVPKGMEVLNNPEDVVAMVAPPRKEEVDLPVGDVETEVTEADGVDNSEEKEA